MNKSSHALVLLEHDFGGLDYGCNRVTDLEIHLFCASTSYHAFDEIVSNFNDNMRHYAAELKLRYSTSTLRADRVIANLPREEESADSLTCGHFLVNGLTGELGNGPRCGANPGLGGRPRRWAEICILAFARIAPKRDDLLATNQTGRVASAVRSRFTF